MIFGTGCPSIVLNNNSELLLDYCKIDSNMIIPKMLTHVAITGKRHYILSGDISEFNVMIYLYKYDTPVSTYNTLSTLQNEVVKFKPHSDLPNVIKNKDGNEALYNIIYLNAYYLFDLSQYDMLKLTFKSNEYVSYFDNQKILGFGYKFGSKFGYRL